MKFPYNDIILEHFKNPRNVGEIESPDGKATEGSAVCGDMVSVFLKVDPDLKTITDIKFKSYGCASNIATGSIITELAKGSTIEEAKKITWKQASDALGGLPPIKTHCSVLAVDCLKEAIRDYEERHGLIKDLKPTTIQVVLERLKHVMNPLAGLDIVETNLISSVEVSNRVVTVSIDLKESHQFAKNLESEVNEKLETLWDVDSIVVKFAKD